MEKKLITKISLFINSILFFIVGITIILFKTKYINIFNIITLLLMVVLCLITLILKIIKAKKIKDISISLSTLIIGIFFYNNKKKFLAIFPITFGIYMLINGLIKFITYILFKEKEKQNYYIVLIGSLIDFTFSFAMIKSPSKNINNLATILGIYLIFFSLTYFKDFIKECYPKKFLNKKKRGFRVTLPTIISVLIPYKVLLKINKILKSDKKINSYINKKVSGKVDLEIFIHVKDSSIGKFGHADLYFENVVYSYGCYDEASKKFLELIGEGTLFEIHDKKKYLKFCTNNSDKTIFSFGITEKKKKKKALKKEIKKIKKNTYKWDPNCSEKNKYAILLQRKTNATFYKFSQGNYKTYFLLFTNCVKLVDNVIGATGSDLLKINGVITPGSYYDFLIREFKKENSNVITENIYTKYNNYL